MAKKSRSARKKSARKVSTAATAAATDAGVSSAAVEPAADANEYAYVTADLRRVAILAGAMFALLIGLSFFIG
jgi:hypothetical protein